MEKIPKQEIFTQPSGFSLEEISILQRMNPDSAPVFGRELPPEQPIAAPQSLWDANYLPKDEKSGSGLYLPNAIGRGQEGGFLPALAPLAIPLASAAISGLAPHAFRWLGSKFFGSGQCGGLSLNQDVFNNGLSKIMSNRIGERFGRASSRNLYGTVRDATRDLISSAILGDNAGLRERLVNTAVDAFIPRGWARPEPLRVMGRGKMRPNITESNMVLYAPVRDAVNRIAKRVGAGRDLRKQVLADARRKIDAMEFRKLFGEDAMTGSGKWFDRIKKATKLVLQHTVDPLAKLAKIGKDKLIDMATEKWNLSEGFAQGAKNITDYPLNFIKDKLSDFAHSPDDPEMPPKALEIAEKATTPESAAAAIEEAVRESSAPQAYVEPASAPMLPGATQERPNPRVSLAKVVHSSPENVAQAFSGEGRRKKAPPRKRGGAKKKTRQTPQFQIKWL